MKYIAVLILTGLLIAGCGKETEQKPIENKDKYAFDSTDIKTSAASNPNEAFVMSYKFEKGKEYTYRLTSIAKQSQTIKSDTTIRQSVNQNIIYILNFKGIESDQDGSELECTVNSVKLDAKGGNQNITYESGKADSATKAKFADYEALVNSPFSLRISKTGEITEIFRVDKVLNKYLRLKGFADSVNAEQKNLIRKEIAEGAIRGLMMQVFKQFPEKTIAKDSTWTKEQPPMRMLVFELNNTNTYKVTGLEMLGNKKLSVIDAGINTKISGESKHTDRGVSYNFRKPVTSAEGKIYFNLSDGMLEKARMKTKVETNYDAEGNTPMGKQKATQSETIETLNILERI